MKVLVTNDDGVQAPGLLAITQALRVAGFETRVLAPDKNWSACGHVKTMSRPMRIQKAVLADGTEAWASDGAPSDCVALALMGALDESFDAVVSGINPNANVGLDVTYSGTVTAAMEGSIGGKPGFAVSMDAPEYHQGTLDFKAAAKVSAEVIKQLLETVHEDETPPIWSINVPYREDGKYAGVQFTRQGVRIYRDHLEKRMDPRGVPYYWIGGEPPSGEVLDGTDYGALKNGFVSVTPLMMDMTDEKKLAKMKPYSF